MSALDTPEPIRSADPLTGQIEKDLMTTLNQQRGSLPATLPVPRYSPERLLDLSTSAAEPEEAGFGETLLRLHLMMRGRYLVSTLFAICVAAGLGYFGYRQGEQTYRSAGQIRIVPTLPRIMYETEDKGVMPMFDSFVQTQVSLIKTQRVIENALEDRGWSPPPPRDDMSKSEFANKLTVGRDNELISVNFESRDPAFAQTAVKTVIAAYLKIYAEADGKENGTVLNQLTQRQAGLSNELATNHTAIRQIAEQYNTDEIEGFFTAKQAEVRTLQDQLATAKAQQAKFDDSTKSAGGISPESLAKDDQTLHALLEDKLAKKLELKSLQAQWGPEHSAVQRAQHMLTVINGSIDERVEELTRIGGGATTQGSNGWQLQIDRLSSDLTVAQQQLKNIGQDQFRLADLKREAADLNDRLSQTRARIEALTTEAPVATGRVTVISDGDRPLVPSKDTRRTLAGTGAVAGFLLPFGVALLLSSANRKFGTPVETRMSAITRDLVLGALPAVDESKFNPEASTLAAHCVHQVRTLMQIRCHGRAQAIAITSARAGSGKTSVVLGLGVSYAMSGSRTLLIDLDLIGGGLTRRAEIQSRVRLGTLLVEQGLITDEQLQQALALATKKQIRLGEAFVETGYLQQAQLDDILRDQRRSHAGLMDALYGKTLPECVSSAGMANLDILPLGSANPHDAATLSPAEIRSLIEEAKSIYDTVLIDTGPVPGSLEASMVASLADGVLVIVARGEPRAGAESSVEHLRRVGGNVMGLVFNRAKPADAGAISGSIYGGTSIRAAAADRPPSPAARQAASTRFGPVGQAVLDLSPANPN